MTVYSLFTYIAIAALVITAIRYFISKPQNLFLNFLQNFLGSLFIFSGFVKAVDPMGTSYKMHDYFEAFASEGLRPFWEWAAQYSIHMSVFMLVFEIVLGVAIIIGWRNKITVTLMLWMNLFFLFLTGYTFLSGYGITKSFILLSLAVLSIYSIIPLLKNEAKQQKLLIAGVLATLVVFALTQMSNTYFTTAFTETKMKVTDCGCFGDFIKLKPWETFYKDVLLTIVCIILVMYSSKLSSLFNEGFRNLKVAGTTLATLVFCLYNFVWNEPVIDFRPYAIGSNLIENMKAKKEPVIAMVYQYKNKATGEIKKLSQNELMEAYKVDTSFATNFEYVDRVDDVLDPGIPAKISNLLIENEEGGNITEQLFSQKGYSAFIVMKKLSETDTKIISEKINPLAKALNDKKIPFYALCSNDGKVQDFRHANQTAFPFYYADETPLKTMLRSNPGMILLKDGIVVGKWHKNHIPEIMELEKNYLK